MSQDANRVHRAAQVAEPGAAGQVVPVRESAPGVGEVRIDVEATGICGADIGTVRNPAPATGFPVTGKLHWASTETAAQYAGRIEGALAAAERAVTASLTTEEANSCSR